MDGWDLHFRVFPFKKLFNFAIAFRSAFNRMGSVHSLTHADGTPGPHAVSAAKGCKCEAERQTMRIVLQQKDTGLYFKDISSWSRDSSEALDFLTSTAAIDFCAMNNLSDAQLVFKFDEEKYDIVLPVNLPPNGMRAQPTHTP